MSEIVKNNSSEISKIPLLDQAEYKRQLVGIDNSSLTSLQKQSCLFPIPLSTDGVFILGWYGKRNFLNQNDKSFHYAIDINAAPGSPVIAPYDGEVVYISRHTSPRSHLPYADVGIYTTNKLFIKLLHLNKDSLPNSWNTLIGFTSQQGFKIKRGDFLGTVGTWMVDSFEKYGTDAIQVSDQIKDYYKQNRLILTPSHVHMAVYNLEDLPGGIKQIYDLLGETLTSRKINPLWILEKLD